ncbi:MULTISPECIES: Gfo/Idh/MocA family protein [unclassified Agromyces]|uniref:Gfo/Idh/MocA family protein n=1 Tax=unclassified Agromyces TaxID=2639701 RepID=UPI003014DDB0
MTTDVIAPARTLHAGFIGGGFMAAVHSRAARAARAELVAGASSSPGRAREAAERLGIAEPFESVEALLADPAVDVVHVCTPNSTHAAIARAALEAGKHVICEKPLATSSADAAALAALAAERGLVAAVPFVYRFHPMAREARARIARGEAGRLVSVHGAYLQDWLAGPDSDDWRVDPALGGPSRAFADIGSHLVDLVEFVTGDRVARLNATTRTVYDRRASATVATEDLAAVVVEFEGGAIGTLLVSQVAPGRKNGLVVEVAGTDASLRFEQERPEQLWIGGVEASRILERDAARLAPDAARLAIVPSGHPMGYQDAFNAFVADAYAAIAGGTAPDGLPGFDDGLRAVRVTEAVLASAESGDWTEVQR